MNLTKEEKQLLVSALSHAMAATQGRHATLVSYYQYANLRKKLDRALRDTA